MNLRDFADLAALLARHSLHIVESDQTQVEELAEEYWVQARRLKREWQNQLDSTVEAREHWVPLAEEFLVADLLTRVWGATLLTVAERHRAVRSRALVQQALGCNLEIRNEVLKTMTHRWEEWSCHVPALDLLRRRLERWTDVLVSPLMSRGRVEEACFSPERALEAGPTYDEGRYHAGATGLWNLTGAALRVNVPDRILSASARRSLHEDQLQRILAAFPTAAFLADGTVRSERFRRIFHTVRETIPPRPVRVPNRSNRPVH